MVIDYIMKRVYELVTVGDMDYRRYSSGTWTTTYAGIEKEVDNETSTELEQAYREFKKNLYDKSLMK